MRQFIEECLTPLYYIHWLDTIYIEPSIMYSIKMRVAMQDNRLLRV